MLPSLNKEDKMSYIRVRKSSYLGGMDIDVYANDDTDEEPIATIWHYQQRENPRTLSLYTQLDNIDHWGECWSELDDILLVVQKAWDDQRNRCHTSG